MRDRSFIERFLNGQHGEELGHYLSGMWGKRLCEALPFDERVDAAWDEIFVLACQTLEESDG